jgi:hypothetical protein
MSEEKQRTRAEVDAEYSQVALLLGHKTRVLSQVKAEAERMEAEMKAHLEKLLELNVEGMKLPVEPPKDAA